MEVMMELAFTLENLIKIDEQIDLINDCLKVVRTTLDSPNIDKTSDEDYEILKNNTLILFEELRNCLEVRTTLIKNLEQ